MELIYDILKTVRPDFDFTESENFIDDGLLDSFDMVALISEIEERFDITIDGLELVPENFETAEAIAGLIKNSGGVL